MDRSSNFDKIIVIWKLTVIETGVDKLQVLKEALDLHKEKLQLSRQQLLLLEHLESNKDNRKLPIIYAVTPTYWRYVQKAELTRISQTLQLVPNVHWIVIEDSEEKTDLVRNLILESKLIATHLNAKTPPFEQIKDKDPRWKRHRGVEQRNMALAWLRENLQLNKDKGVVYFMDDDNTYNIKLFTEIGKVKKVGVWPVGLVGGLNAETPILDSTTDMAGFAINLDLILAKHEAVFSYAMEKGLQESEFLSYFTTKEELEPLADNCTKVYVWHTRTEKPVVNGIVQGLEV
ncbi:hypothetical protein NQ314_006077 [Rhamnusium bicolor]|uniref:Galactosylgalactosylxylosylprotein 3-beta-glucuronosyltransferase n=1 Tax=Rhamnusium bicolor TaxID=1586634 RepID=A0AAV8Z8S0_9CUCU|nr:hypothetical protein NQ314_006077 [Rhamnusium bicolor]